MARIIAVPSYDGEITRYLNADAIIDFGPEYVTVCPIGVCEVTVNHNRTAVRIGPGDDDVLVYAIQPARLAEMIGYTRGQRDE